MLVTCTRQHKMHPASTAVAKVEQHEAASASQRTVPTSNGHHHGSFGSALASAGKTVGPSTMLKQRKGTELSDFHRWRPSFHLIAPKNWLNDPCGPCYDERTGLFHLLYQYNPQGATWGNMSWLHATSKDLVHWSHVSDQPNLAPEQEHDREGVFSGAMVPHGPKGEPNMLTVFYTAVSKLPIHFTKPYNWGAEKVAMATSVDGGVTWQRSTSSVLVPSPPDEFRESVASWRDPFISAWPEMDDRLGLPRDTFLYGLISGCLRGKTPTAFLYRIDKSDLSVWTYISTIADVGLNFALGEASGDMGRNWEVCNFFTLAQHEGPTSQYLLMNVEGVGEDLKSRHPMWAQVKFVEGSASRSSMTPLTSGLVDHGCLYAATTFLHSPTGRRLMWGWVTEDDLAESRYDQQGWSGCISLPREVVQLTYDDVHSSMKDHALVKHSFDVTEEHGATRLTVLGTAPAKEVSQLRIGAKYIALDECALNRASWLTLPIESRTFELNLVFAIHDRLQDDDEFGVMLAHSACKRQATKVIFKNEALHVVRALSSTDPDVNTKDVVAPMPLIRFADGSTEPVEMHIFLDNSVLEVFVNRRTVITTRIYCDDDVSNMVSLINQTSARSTGVQQNGKKQCDSTRASVAHVEAWVGLQNAMMSQPAAATMIMAEELKQSADSDAAARL